MVDCGLSVKAITDRMVSIGRHPNEVSALLVTHEHSDHTKGMTHFTRRFDTQVWMTCGTAAALGADDLLTLQTFNCHKKLAFGEIGVQPYPVPHDAREPCQYVFTAADRRLGVITDTGHVTPHILDCLAYCDALGIECNHDPEVLWQGQYPKAVKERVTSKLGHLSNSQAAGTRTDSKVHILSFRCIHRLNYSLQLYIRTYLRAFDKNLVCNYRWHLSINCP